jgi:hypothetical protein
MPGTVLDAQSSPPEAGVIMRSLTESEWERFIEYVDQLRRLPPATRGSFIAALSPVAEDSDILQLAEAALRFMEEEDNCDEFLHSLRDDLNWKDLYGFLIKLHRREELARSSLKKVAQELVDAEQQRTVLEAMLRKLLKQPPLPEGLRAWAKKQSTDEEVFAGLRQLRAEGGFELSEFLGELEQVVHGK